MNLSNTNPKDIASIEPKTFHCGECNTLFRSKQNLQNHQRRFHSLEASISRPYKCVHCSRSFSRNSVLKKHIFCIHTATSRANSQSGGALKRKRIVRSAFDGSIVIEQIHAEENESVGSGLIEFMVKIKAEVFSSLPIHNRVYLQVCVSMEKDGNEREAYFRSKSEIYTATLGFDDFYARAVDKMEKSLQKFNNNGSGWVLASIKWLEIRRMKYNMVRF